MLKQSKITNKQTKQCYPCFLICHVIPRAILYLRCQICICMHAFIQLVLRLHRKLRFQTKNLSLSLVKERGSGLDVDWGKDWTAQSSLTITWLKFCLKSLKLLIFVWGLGYAEGQKAACAHMPWLVPSKSSISFLSVHNTDYSCCCGIINIRHVLSAGEFVSKKKETTCNGFISLECGVGLFWHNLSRDEMT